MTRAEETYHTLCKFPTLTRAELREKMKTICGVAVNERAILSGWKKFHYGKKVDNNSNIENPVLATATLDQESESEKPPKKSSLGNALVLFFASPKSPEINFILDLVENFGNEETLTIIDSICFLGSENSRTIVEAIDQVNGVSNFRNIVDSLEIVTSSMFDIS